MQILVRVSLFIILMTLVYTPHPVFSAMPETINYQGYLTDTGGVPVEGTRNLTFCLYLDAAGTQPAGVGGGWCETHSLEVINGIFNIILGGANAFSSFIPAFDQTFYLGISIDGATEMEPRQPLSAVPYALNATSLDGQDSTAFAPSAHSHGGTDINGPLEITSDVGGQAIYGLNSTPGGVGVRGYGGSMGVWGQSDSDGSGAVVGHAGSNGANFGVIGVSSSSSGYGVYGKNTGNGYAGAFEGPVSITGSVTVSEAVTASYFNGNGAKLTNLEWANLIGMPIGFSDGLDNDCDGVACELMTSLFSNCDQVAVGADGTLGCGSEDDSPDNDAEVPDNITVDNSASGSLVLEQNAAPANITEGRLQWDTDDDQLVVGTGAGTSTFHPGPHTPYDGVPTGFSILGENSTPPSGYSFTGLTVTAKSGYEWAEKAKIGQHRENMITVSMNGLIYVIGGRVPSDGSQLGLVDIYDPTSDSWTSGANMGYPRTGHTAGAINGKIYAVGGPAGTEETWGVLNEEYDPVGDAWVPKPSMPTARSNAASAVLNGKLYVVGGLALNGDLLLDNEMFDPIANSWTVRTPISIPLNTLSPVAAAANGKIYIFYGGDTYEYDPTANVWATVVPMLPDVGYSTATTLNNKIYLFGGFTDSIGTLYSLVDEFDPATMIYNRHEPMNPPRSGMSSAAAGGEIYVIGGERFNPNPADPWSFTVTYFSNNTEFTPPKKLWLHTKN